MANSLTESVAPRSVTNPRGVWKLVGRYNIDNLRGLEGQAAWKGIDDAATLPVELWKLANLKFDSVLDRKNLLLRDAGYVIWDGYVGETMEALERVEDCSWTFNGRLLPHEIPRLRHVMTRSWTERSKIWLEGGWGYWEGGDENTVRYKSAI